MLRCVADCEMNEIYVTKHESYAAIVNEVVFQKAIL